VEFPAAYLSRIENEKEPPPSEQIIEKLAIAFGADKYELFSYAEKVPPEFLETFKKTSISVISNLSVSPTLNHQ